MVSSSCTRSETEETEEGGTKRERRERERKEKEAGLKSIFVQNLHGSSKSFEYESCVENLKPTTFVSGKSLFEQWFNSCFQFTTTRI
jgi:hypothetical protein